MYRAKMLRPMGTGLQISVKILTRKVRNSNLIEFRDTLLTRTPDKILQESVVII